MSWQDSERSMFSYYGKYWWETEKCLGSSKKYEAFIHLSIIKEKALFGNRKSGKSIFSEENLFSPAVFCQSLIIALDKKYRTDRFESSETI